jgi:hypothetical protein
MGCIRDTVFPVEIRTDYDLKRQKCSERLVKSKIAFFWVVAPCSLVEFYQRPDDGGSKDLWNAGKLLPDYKTLQPIRQPSSYLPPWEPHKSYLVKSVSNHHTGLRMEEKAPW